MFSVLVLLFVVVVDHAVALHLCLSLIQFQPFNSNILSSQVNGVLISLLSIPLLVSLILLWEVLVLCVLRQYKTAHRPSLIWAWPCKLCNAGIARLKAQKDNDIMTLK